MCKVIQCLVAYIQKVLYFKHLFTKPKMLDHADIHLTKNVRSTLHTSIIGSGFFTRSCLKTSILSDIPKLSELNWVLSNTQNQFTASPVYRLKSVECILSVRRWIELKKEETKWWIKVVRCEVARFILACLRQVYWSAHYVDIDFSRIHLTLSLYNYLMRYTWSEQI